MKPRRPPKVLFVRHSGLVMNFGDLFISMATADTARRLEARGALTSLMSSYVPYTQFGPPRFQTIVRGALHGIRTVAQSQKIVILGGNLLIPRSLKFNLCAVFYGLLARLFFRRLIFFGIGVAKPGTDMSLLNRFLFTFAVKAAHEFFVRDEHSAQVIEQIRGSRPDIVGDCAFLHGSDLLQEPARQSACLVPVGYEDAAGNLCHRVMFLNKDEYLKFHVEIIEALRKRDIEVVLSMTSPPRDADFVRELQLATGVRAEVVTSVSTMLETIGSHRFVIAARMHGLIAGMTMGSRVVGLKYQEKLQGLTDNLGGSPPVFPIQLGMADEIVEALLTECPMKPQRLDALRDKLEFELLQALGLADPSALPTSSGKRLQT